MFRCKYRSFGHIDQRFCARFHAEFSHRLFTVFLKKANSKRRSFYIIPVFVTIDSMKFRPLRWANIVIDGSLRVLPPHTLPQGNGKKRILVALYQKKYRVPTTRPHTKISLHSDYCAIKRYSLSITLSDLPSISKSATSFKRLLINLLDLSFQQYLKTTFFFSPSSLFSSIYTNE